MQLYKVVREVAEVGLPAGTYWYKDPECQIQHRADGPAFEGTDGSWMWCQEGKFHRPDGPALFYRGNLYWYRDSKCHRVDGPAVELANGTKNWYIEGKKHRTDGPAVEFVNGDKEYWVNGKLHRTDGPAIECVNGTRIWSVNGDYHRVDGPAMEYTNGISNRYFLIDWEIPVECHQHVCLLPIDEMCTAIRMWFRAAK